jgi:hypothetical protein
MIRMEKIIDVIRDKNINLHWLHLYFSIAGGLIWKYIFSRVFKLFLMEKGDVASCDVPCLHVEIIHH